MKRNFFLFGIFFLLACVLPFISLSQTTINKVVIDAGHGGHDPGTVGHQTKEKDITLAVALKLGAFISNAYPNTQVIYTRRSDVFVELKKRTKIANDNKADLFISIHCNGATASDARGAETWVMGLNKSEANLAVAKKENASILLEDNYSSQYEGFDPNSPEAYVIFALYQNAFLDQSVLLASLVQQQINKKLCLTDRGVKQAGFLVLYKTTMPGVLVELGFLSNVDEEKLLSCSKGQDSIAKAIFYAFENYQKNTGISASYDNTFPSSSAKPETTFRAPVVQKEFVKEEKEKMQEIFFRVQFKSSQKKIPLSSPSFKGLNQLKVYVDKGVYKYTVGNEKTLSAANVLQRQMVNKGYRDAFVVAFCDDKRVSIKDAVQLLKK